MVIAAHEDKWTVDLILGTYVAAIPGRAVPATPRSRLATARRILIVLLSAALVVNLALRVRNGRRAARQAADEHVV